MQNKIVVKQKALEFFKGLRLQGDIVEYCIYYSKIFSIVERFTSIFGISPIL